MQTTITGRPGAGRPPLPASARMNRRIPVGLTPAERALVDNAANTARITRSEWIRRVILTATTNDAA